MDDDRNNNLDCWDHSEWAIWHWPWWTWLFIGMVVTLLSIPFVIAVMESSQVFLK